MTTDNDEELAASYHASGMRVHAFLDFLFRQWEREEEKRQMQEKWAAEKKARKVRYAKIISINGEPVKQDARGGICSY